MSGFADTPSIYHDGALAKCKFVPAVRLLKRVMLSMDDLVSQVMPMVWTFEVCDMIRAGQAREIVINPTR